MQKWKKQIQMPAVWLSIDWSTALVQSQISTTTGFCTDFGDTLAFPLDTPWGWHLKFVSFVIKCRLNFTEHAEYRDYAQRGSTLSPTTVEVVTVMSYILCMMYICWLDDWPNV